MSKKNRQLEGENDALRKDQNQLMETQWNLEEQMEVDEQLKNSNIEQLTQENKQLHKSIESLKEENQQLNEEIEKNEQICQQQKEEKELELTSEQQQLKNANQTIHELYQIIKDMEHTIETQSFTYKVHHLYDSIVNYPYTSLQLFMILIILLLCIFSLFFHSCSCPSVHYQFPCLLLFLHHQQV